MRLARQEGKIFGAKVNLSTPPITHLMFADDYILFGETSRRGICVLKDILEQYEDCSSQCVNFEKSTVFFNSNVNDQDKNLVFQILNVRCSMNPKRYLGLPIMVGRKKKLAFQNLKDHLKQRINSWSLRHISQGGREVFMKVVLQAIPTYTMACFLLPKSVHGIGIYHGGILVEEKSRKTRHALVRLEVFVRVKGRRRYGFS